MDYRCRETIIQNMNDFGCDENTIKNFLKYYDQRDVEGEKKILNSYRQKLLNDLHKIQKDIDILDYMSYQLNKCNCE